MGRNERDKSDLLKQLKELRRKLMKHLIMKSTERESQWRMPRGSAWASRLICVPAAMLFFILSAPAQTDAILPLLGGRGGGQFVARCPQGQYLTGVELRTGNDVEAIRIICV